MAKFAVVTCTDGNFLIRSEHSSRDAAVMEYDSLHRSLTGDTSTLKATIKILDEQLDVLEGKWQDTIVHPQPEPQPEPEPTPEPTAE